MTKASALSNGNKALPGKANRYGQPGLSHRNIAVFIGEYDFHPPIQAAIAGRVVAGYRIGFAIAARGDLIAVNDRGNQGRAHGVCATVRQRLIHVVAARETASCSVGAGILAQPAANRVAIKPKPISRVADVAVSG